MKDCTPLKFLVYCGLDQILSWLLLTLVLSPITTVTSSNSHYHHLVRVLYYSYQAAIAFV
jgi:hypothetical protein